MILRTFRGRASCAREHPGSMTGSKAEVQGRNGRVGAGRMGGYRILAGFGPPCRTSATMEPSGRNHRPFRRATPGKGLVTETGRFQEITKKKTGRRRRGGREIEKISRWIVDLGRFPGTMALASRMRPTTENGRGELLKSTLFRPVASNPKSEGQRLRKDSTSFEKNRSRVDLSREMVRIASVSRTKRIAERRQGWPPQGPTRIDQPDEWRD